MGNFETNNVKFGKQTPFLRFKPPPQKSWICPWKTKKKTIKTDLQQVCGLDSILVNIFACHLQVQVQIRVKIWSSLLQQKILDERMKEDKKHGHVKRILTYIKK